MQRSATSEIMMAEIRQRDLLADAARVHHVAVDHVPARRTRRVRTTLGRGLIWLGTRLPGGAPARPSRASTP
jgi:hypothetical protein